MGLTAAYDRLEYGSEYRRERRQEFFQCRVCKVIFNTEDKIICQQCRIKHGFKPKPRLIKNTHWNGLSK